MAKQQFVRLNRHYERFHVKSVIYELLTFYNFAQNPFLLIHFSLQSCLLSSIFKSPTGKLKVPKVLSEFFCLLILTDFSYQHFSHTNIFCMILEEHSPQHFQYTFQERPKSINSRVWTGISPKRRGSRYVMKSDLGIDMNEGSLQLKCQ